MSMKGTFQQQLKMDWKLLPPLTRDYHPLSNLLANKWFDFMIASHDNSTITPFPTCYLMKRFVTFTKCASFHVLALVQGAWSITQLPPTFTRRKLKNND